MSPWSVKSKPRRRMAQLAVFVATVAAVVGVTGPAQATPESEDAQAIGNAIESFADRLSSAADALGEYGDLANNLPLGDLAPGDPGALDLSKLLKDAIGPLSSSSMSALAGEIEARDGIYGGVTVQFGSGAFSQPAVSATATSITIPIHAERHVDQPLDFAFGPVVEMKGGSLGIDFELNTTLTFNVDSAAIVSAATAPPTALSVDPATIDVCARATGSVGLFTARFGFTDVNVSTDNPATAGTTETANLHACARVAFSDPDSTGGITLDEWTSHALSELASANVVKGNPGGNDLDATFYVDATLVDGDAFATNGAADASIAFTDADLSNGFDANPTPTVGPGLQAWLNITAGDVANGLGQFVSSLAGAQGLGNGQLPLIKKSLTEVFDGVRPLVDYTERLLNATVGCGTEPGTPDHFPSGITDNLAAGTLVYCRASTHLDKQPGSVVWSPPAGVTNVDAVCAECANTSGAAADATLGSEGATPTADAVFKMVAPGNFTIQLTWDADPGADPLIKKAIPRPGSAQELFDRIAEAAGLDDDLLNLGYDATAKSLTFRLQKENFDGPQVKSDASIGDLLRNATNLSGLTDTLQGSNVSFKASVKEINFDVTFGVLLNEHTSDITPIRGTATAGSSGATLTDSGANFTDGVNDPRLGETLKKTSAPVGECSISAITATTLTCAAGSGVSWSAGNTYDVDGGLLDRFYLQIDPSQPELAVGDIEVEGGAELTGKVGFLEVEAKGAGDKNTFSPGTAFGIGKADSSKPVFALDIKAPSPFTVDAGSPTTIPNAVGVAEVLFNLDSAHVGAVCNLKATAGLEVKAKIDGKDLASGGVALNWPSAFKAGSCVPDPSTVQVTADTDFNLNLKDFDPFPTVTGKHTAATSTNLFDATKNFEANALNGDNLLNLTLRNKTTGASCTIAFVNVNELECDLSGGTRADDEANKNKWKTGDEYEVEGNALAWLGYILDNLDKVVEQIDKIDPGLTDKELPLVGISTKDLVAKIKSIKQTTDELRGSPLAKIDCSGNPNGSNPANDSLGRPFNIQMLPDNTTLYCRANGAVMPTDVEWLGLRGNVSIGALVTGSDDTTTVGHANVDPTANNRIAITVGDGDATRNDDTAISEWQIQVKFVDAAGDHTTEFPTSVPPQSLQQLEDLIGEKIGVDDVLELDLLDLPAAGQGPRTTGSATGGSTEDNVLEDTAKNFPSLPEAERPFVGNLLINTTDKKQCTITQVTTNTLACPDGSDMQWTTGDAYQVVGDRTKDLVVRLGVGFCSGGGVDCADTDRPVPALSAPLNVKDDFANIVSVSTTGEISLDYAARAQLDVGIPLKLDLTPDVVVLDTSGASVEASLNADDIGLSAAIGPVTVELGTAAEGGAGSGVGKLGAKLGLTSDDDDVKNNKTRTFTDFLSNVSGSFDGVSQECDSPEGNPVEATGDACAVLSVTALGTDFGAFKIECDIGSDPLCDAELPAALTNLISGEQFDWTLLVQILPQILANLEKTLDGAAQGIKLPLIGDALDAGANVVGTFNNEVITPFAQLVEDLKTAGQVDSDSDVDAYDLAKLTRDFIVGELGPSGADLLRDTNGDGSKNAQDVVVTPLCGNPAVVCANGDGVTTLNLIRDFRVTFEIGQGIDGEVPFDIGLKGLPVRLTGGVKGAGSWSLLVDFGLSFQDGPYVVANGKKGFTGTENRPFDKDTDDPPDGTNDAHDPVRYLQDDSANFTNTAELGMWLKNTSSGQGCRVTKIEATKLYCDDFGLGEEGPVTWDGDDGYELIARHAPDTPGDGGRSELNLEASVSMGNLPSEAGFTCTDDNHDYDSPGMPAYLNGFSTERCLAGELAFLQVTMRDAGGTLNCETLAAAGDNPTALCLNATLDFKKSGGNRVSLSDVISGNFSFAPKLSGKANIDVRFRTGLNTGQSAGFPSVLGKFHLFWGFSAEPGTGLNFAALEISFDGLNLDAGKFLSSFLSPIVKQIKNVTNPLMPVVELLQGEIPIISDLSKLLGKGPVTVLDVLEAISGNDLSLLRSILQFVKFVNSLPTDGNLLIPLGTDPATGGKFEVTGERAGNSQPIPEEANKGITNAQAGKDLVDKLGESGSPYSSAKTPPSECVGRGSTFGVCGLTFPFLGDASQIFGVLMGKDATLVHYDAGSFGAGAGFGFCFPPILIGPVPVQICIGGSFRVEGRFAMGYDTSGLRKVLAGGTGTHLLDGIYFDDYDANGVDVPEVKFTGTVYAEGAVSVYIFKVGIRGEIIFTTGLNLHEDAPQDGKLRIEEIVSKIFNPLCLFDVEGKIEAALSAFVKIDLFITSVEFSIQIVKITLLEFKLDVCNIVPVLARTEGVGTANERLILHMGSEAGKRGIAPGEPDEKFTVRQMESYTSGPNAGKTRFSVTAFGIQQDYFLTTSRVGTSEAKLIANGLGGDDVVSLLPGSASGDAANPSQQKPPIPFTLWAQIDGDDGNDEISTGEGNDVVTGGNHDDSISTGGGADTINGNGGNDKIDAGPGNDSSVHGDGGNDIVNGGPGADKLFGDADDDVLSSGPGDPSGTHVDELHGGAGNDTLTADNGGDKMWGDEDLDFDCSSDGSTSSGLGGRDSLIGGDGNDQMHAGNGADSLDGAKGGDTMCGGGGNDEMTGAEGKDTMTGGGGDDNMVGGSDDGTGDTMHGGSGRDYMLGDEGSLTRDGSNNVAVSLTGSFIGADLMNGDAGDDFMWGQGGVDTMNGGGNDDEMRGGLLGDTMNGNAGDDEMYGEDGDDTMNGNADNDLMRGGPGVDTMHGNEHSDEMYGDGENDVMFGDAGDDLMRGGGGDDTMEGGANDTSALPLDNASNPLDNVNFDLKLVPSGANGWAPSGGSDGDVMYGDAGQDDVVGGSQGGSPPADRGDTILGNTEQDVILGDNGTVTRPGGTEPDGTKTRTVVLTDPGSGIAQADGDWIQGNTGNDDIYAGDGGDLVHGDEGDDYVEGNGDSDGAGVLGGNPVASIGLYGDAGQDDLIGGTSQGSGGVADGSDDIWGGDDHDVAAGDNATITRTGGGACGGFVCNTFRAPDVANVVIRRVRIWDVATTTSMPGAGTAGNDTIGGQAGHDRLYGQGGGDDIKGGPSDDFAFGNAGSDTIRGGDGQDDLIGGTGRTDSATPGSAVDGRLDAGDVIYGEADFDAIAGDNSRMVRATTGANDDQGTWVANSFNAAVDRLIALMDVGTVGSAAGAGTSGNDELLGGAADDVVYGQGGNDGISGGDGQDILEGNANGSGNAPDPGGTYGGSFPAFAGDVIHGDAGADDIAGGTGWIYRMVGGVETGDPIESGVRVGTDGRLDGADTIFGDGGGDAIAGDNTVIERALTAGGAWILDDLHAPDALGVVRRIMRQRDVALAGNPAGGGTSGGDVIYGNDGVDIAYGQGGGDSIQGNASDDHLEGNAGNDTIEGNEGRDDIVGGTGRTFSNVEATAADGRLDGEDTLHGGDGLGGVATDDDDTIIGDNGTVDRLLGPLPAAGDPELGRLPFNGAWGETTWNAPNILRVVRLLDVSRTGASAADGNGTNGADTLNGEANADVLFGQGGGDTITGDDADLGAASAADANPGDDYVEGGGGSDTIRGDLGQDDVTGGGSAANGVLDANRDGRFDDDRSGETLRDAGDSIKGDSGAAAVGDGDVVAGDNARIQRLLNASGAWRDDAQRGTKLRDVVLFDIRIVGNAEPGNADPGESGADTIDGNGGNDILLGQDNGQSDDAAGDAYGREDGGFGAPDCQDATGGPGTGAITNGVEFPTGDNDGDKLPDVNDPQCRVPNPAGDTIHGDDGQDYVEGNSGSDNLYGDEGEDDLVGGSSSNTGHLQAILPPADRAAGFAPGNLAEASKPNNLNDGHDYVEGNAEDDAVTGDNAFVDRYLGAGGAWITILSTGRPAGTATPVPNPHPGSDPWDVTEMIRRAVTMKGTPIESPLAFGNDVAKGGHGKDDIYGQLGHDWIEGNDGEDAIVGDLGVIVNNAITNGGVGDELADPSPLDEFIAPQQPFLGEFRHHAGILKREVTLFAFNESLSGAQAAGIGHDVALGGAGNDSIHTGPGEDLANGNGGDDFIFLGDNFTATTATAKKATDNRLAHDRVDAGWGGVGHDHLFGGYGADYLDVRPRSAASAPGIFPAPDPETWFQVAGPPDLPGDPSEASPTGVFYDQDNFEGIDYIYGGWDQDTLQANEGDNGPVIGDRLLDWAGSYNGYYLCPSTYGDWVSTRALAPGLADFIQKMSEGDGATATATPGTSGFRETAIVFNNEAKDNTKPIHVDTPAHFTCGPGTVTP
ncbi:MAG TPA: calcium-binding protein [Actinomycetota bacterium]|nr:calcium-binding protein [Actinomycetota bacterium]